MKTVIVCTLLSLAAAAVVAQETPRADARQNRQEKRIDQGQASGQLSEREAGRLEREQAAVQRVEDKAKADGTVTARERKRLQHAQNHTSRDIARQKHDRQQNKPAAAPAIGANTSPGG